MKKLFVLLMIVTMIMLVVFPSSAEIHEAASKEPPPDALIPFMGFWYCQAHVNGTNNYEYVLAVNDTKLTISIYSRDDFYLSTLTIPYTFDPIDSSINIIEDRKIKAMITLENDKLTMKFADNVILPFERIKNNVIDINYSLQQILLYGTNLVIP